jgi:hypothetical protein
MEKIMMLWDEADDLMAVAPRVLAAAAAAAAAAAITLIVAAAFLDRLWPI